MILGPYLGPPRPTLGDDLQPQRIAQRRPGVVTMPAGQLDQLVEDRRLLGPIGTGIRPRLGLGHCLSLTHRQTHLLGVPDSHPHQ